jgi:hypothetical protein
MMMHGVMSRPAMTATSRPAPRFQADTEKALREFDSLPPEQQVMVAAKGLAANRQLFVRQALLEACLDTWKLESQFAKSYFINSLKAKNVQGVSVLAEMAEYAGPALTDTAVLKLTAEIILERAEREPDPALKALAAEQVPTLRLALPNLQGE